MADQRFNPYNLNNRLDLNTALDSNFHPIPTRNCPVNLNSFIHSETCNHSEAVQNIGGRYFCLSCKQEVFREKE